jgi:hypothetical protein
MSGTLGPVTDQAPADSTSDGAVRMIVRGGQVLGKCRIDRRTGLPVQSRVEQSIDMLVHLADGTELEQFKTTVTTLETRTGEASPFPPPSTAARNEAGLSPR